MILMRFQFSFTSTKLRVIVLAPSQLVNNVTSEIDGGNLQVNRWSASAGRKDRGESARTPLTTKACHITELLSKYETDIGVFNLLTSVIVRLKPFSMSFIL